MSSLRSPVPISKVHDTDFFDCGVAPLNEYLRKYALLNHNNRAARTYVALRDNQVVGYYALANGSVHRDETPARISKGLGRYPVPVTILARLAVDISEQGKGLGRGLLKDTLLRSLQAADIVGSRAVVVHAKDKAAQKFYQQYQFEPSPLNEFHLYLLMKEIQAVAGA